MPYSYAANIVNIDENKCYRESDFKLLNLLEGLQKVYGKEPIIYQLADTTNKNKWVYSLDLYIFASGANKASKQYSVTSIGQRGKVSIYCGKSSGVVRPGVSKHLDGNEIPNIVKRNVIPDFAPGDNLANSAYVFTEDRQTILQRNASQEEVAAVFREYLAMAKIEGADALSTNRKKLFFINQRTGEKEAITSYAKLMEVFPSYFQLGKQLEADFLTSIFGPGTENKKIFVDGQWWSISAGYVGLWKMYAEMGLSDTAIRRELIDIGYTEKQVETIRGIRGLTADDLGNQPSGSGSSSGSGGSGGSGNSGGARTSNNQSWTGPEGYQTGLLQQITIQRSKNIFLTSDEVSTAIGNDLSVVDKQNATANPIMYQVYPGDPRPNITQYIFDMAPNEINYSNFGGEWVSIERIGGFPYIDWKNFKLLQVSFSFTIAARVGITADGLQISVMEQIEKLQRMAQTPFPVMLYRFDNLLTNQFRYDQSGQPRGVQFVIQDLSIAATQRNPKMEITRATANLTLQEIPIERTNLIGMPRLVHKKIKPDEPVPFTDPEYGKTSDNLTSKPNREMDFVSE